MGFIGSFVGLAFGENKIKFGVALYRVGGRPGLILFLYSPLGKIGEKPGTPYRAHN